jgi:hypothetical protein
MADRVPFLVRLDPEVLAALRRWAGDDLRSLNAEIEFLLRRALLEARRLPVARIGDEVEPPAD